MGVFHEISKIFSNAIQNWDGKRVYEASQFHRTPGFTEEWGEPVVDAEGSSGGNEKKPMQIVQFRPAYALQLYLKAAGIEFEAVNSNYAVNELTGPLPFLVDGTAMVGPKDILLYLKEKGIILEDADHSHVWEYFLDQLRSIQCFLRYETDAWENVYRKQVLEASGGARLGRWQAYAERLHNTKTNYTLESAIESAKRVYNILEKQLGGGPYLLGTDRPAQVDCLLFDHLLQATSDVYLVVVLADYPKLIRYTQLIWDTYFVDDVSSTSNLENAFATIPLLPQAATPEIAVAVDLMEQLSVQKADLSRTLEVTKKARAEETMPSSYDPLVTWNRWRKSGPRLDEKEARLKEYQLNDEIWISGVVLTTTMILLGFGFPISQN